MYSYIVLSRNVGTCSYNFRLLIAYLSTIFCTYPTCLVNQTYAGVNLLPIRVLVLLLMAKGLDGQAGTQAHQVLGEEKWSRIKQSTCAGSCMALARNSIRKGRIKLSFARDFGTHFPLSPPDSRLWSALGLSARERGQKG